MQKQNENSTTFNTSTYEWKLAHGTFFTKVYTGFKNKRKKEKPKFKVTTIKLKNRKL